MLPETVPTIFTAPEPPIGAINTREEMVRIAPQINEMMVHVAAEQHKLTGSIKPGAGCTVSSRYVSEVLEGFLARNHIPHERVCSQAIIIELPPTLEEAISVMAVQAPRPFNCCTTSCLGMDTYLEWPCLPTDNHNRESEQRPTHLWVRELDLYDVLKEAASKCFQDQEAPSWCWIPVIFVCGTRVAVGGFAMDEGFFDVLHIAAFQSTNYRPHRMFTQDELAQAALEEARVGCMPWFDSLWTMDDMTVLAVRLWHCNTSLDDQDS